MRPTTLTPCQETQWEFIYALWPDDPGRSLWVVVENRFLEGPLDMPALRRAFQDVARRHDGLRLALDRIGPDPRVRVDDHVDPPVEYLDLSGLDDGGQRTAISELSFHENRRRFDLRSAPLWHVWVVRLAETRYLLNACFSHVIADGWAPRVFVEDLLSAYGARLGGTHLPDDALSFAEIHALQSRRLEASADRRRYWRESLLPLPQEGGPLSMLRAHPDADLMARATMDFWFPRDTRAALDRAAWRARTTTFVALMAAYHLQICLAHGRDRSVINTAVGGRATNRERRALLQFAVDPYVCMGAPDVATLGDVTRAAGSSLEAALKNAMSYKAIARAVNADFDAQRPWPAFNLCDGNFIDAAFWNPRMRRAGLTVTQRFIPGRPPAGYTPELTPSRLPDSIAPAWAARCGPGMLVYPGREGGRLRYNSALHSAESMQAMLDHYLWIVDAVARRPEMTVAALRDEYERRR